MCALTLLTETTEAEESRSLKLKTDMLLVEISICSFHPPGKESRLQERFLQDLYNNGVRT
jgi:hypothetical protein